MLLTKKPLRYSNFFIPNNCIIGTSIASNNDYERYDDLLCADVYDHNRRFVSIEPLMGDCSLLVFRELEFVIVGAMTGKNPVIPRKEWLDSIRHERIYLKDNILKYGL
uniref:Uncharacterized protein n=1 Tax=viral metagenome TaxID=1070528 RepID=A0A6M3KKZ0_9ZZZZ